MPGLLTGVSFSSCLLSSDFDEVGTDMTQTDFAPPAPRRHLLRLWLATPESEGGWALPMPDSNEKKRGGVQVNNTPPKAPLDAE